MLEFLVRYIESQLSKQTLQFQKCFNTIYPMWRNGIFGKAIKSKYACDHYNIDIQKFRAFESKLKREFFDYYILDLNYIGDDNYE